MRGLDIRKLLYRLDHNHGVIVSVPLRGLDIRKHGKYLAFSLSIAGFSPLAGIRYSETLYSKSIAKAGESSFSPLAGIRYSETTAALHFSKVQDIGFSPLAGIRYSETRYG